MTLDELILALEAADPAMVLPLGFSNPHSYRGDYMELAFEPTANVTVGAMLADARSARGATYQGHKGGEFTMHGHTECWLVEEDTSDNAETLGVVLLTLLLAAGQLDGPTQEVLSGFESQWVTMRKASA